MSAQNNKGVPLTMMSLECWSKLTGSTDTPISQVLTFLHVAYRNEVSMAELEKLTGVTQSSVSRNVSKIGAGVNPREPGLGLVEASEDPYYRKRKLVRLTEKGKRLAGEINKVSTRLSPS